MSCSGEQAMAVNAVEQGRDEKAMAENTVEQFRNGKAVVENGTDQARNEASAKWTEEAQDSNESGPSVGIIFNFSPVLSLVTTLKRLRPNIRVKLVLSDLDGITEAQRQTLQSIDVLLTQPVIVGDFRLTLDLPNLKWMHCLAAGVDTIIKAIEPAKTFPTYALTRNCGYFDRQMAEYVIGMIIARELHFQELWENQTKKLWTVQDRRMLGDLTLGIVGFGSIGKEVARVVKLFGLRVWALVRSMPTEVTKCPEVDEYRLLSDIGDLLSSCDYVISVLPSSPSTDGFFDGDILSKCKPKRSVFMNIGRGNVIHNSTILRALDEGWISHAILDVFEKEPLPLDSQLWTHPQVTITPHISGIGIHEELFLKSFVENYDRFISGRPLIYAVDWSKGY